MQQKTYLIPPNAIFTTTGNNKILISTQKSRLRMRGKCSEKEDDEKTERTLQTNEVVLATTADKNKIMQNINQFPLKTQIIVQTRHQLVINE